MAEISNDTEFRHQLKGLDTAQQRVVAARFIESVMALSDDERIRRVANVAVNTHASADEIATALHTARAATIDSHTRCGSEGDWQAQAGYFVARAAVAAVSPEGQMAGGPAWQAAMSCRMAVTCQSIDGAEDTTGEESGRQYRILADYLNS